MAVERVQKILAQSGIGSRRYCETLILAGRVTVNAHSIQLGAKADPEKDQIRLDGELLGIREKKIYILFNKPKGVLSSSRSQGGKPTVFDFVKAPARVFPVGRLDLDSQGLLLLTNDGELANRLMHPRYGHEKEYRVLLDQRPNAQQLQRWRRGLQIVDGKPTRPAMVKFESGKEGLPWLRVILHEGRKRQIRETAKAIGLEVLQLIRVRIGPLQLGRLKSGSWRYLTKTEISQLLESKVGTQRGRDFKGKNPSKSARRTIARPTVRRR